MDADFLLIIDGSSLLSTQYFGNLPREILYAKTPEEKEKYYYKLMKTSSGVYTNAVFGFLKALFRILRDQKPRYMAVTWDLTRDTFRRSLYPVYKANRGDTPVPLFEQFNLMPELLRRMGIPEFMSEDYEADDYSGTLASRFEGQVPVRILTKDHDYLQLVSPRTHLWLIQTTKEKTDELFRRYNVKNEGQWPEKTFEFDEERVFREFEVHPSEVPFLKGLMGDSSDNIPGVPGIGPKTAVGLVRAYGDPDHLYDAIRDLTPEKEKALKAEWKERYGITRSPLSYLLREGESQVTPENGGAGLSAEASMRLSTKLAEIVRDVPLQNVSLDDLLVDPDRAEVEKILNELEISSISSDFLKTSETPVMEERIREIDDFDDLMRFEEACMGDTALGVFYQSGEGLYVSRGDRTVTLLRERFFITKKGFGDFVRRLTKAGIPVYVFDGKAFYKEFGIILRDVTIAAYLLNPLVNAYTTGYLASTYTDLSLAPKDDKETDPFRLALIPLISGVRLMKELEDSGMFRLYTDLELRTMACLADLETTGILVKKEALAEFSETLKAETDRLEAEIFALSGEPFNINSPKQLAEVLFEKLQIPYPKKNAKGHYSTGADILEKLAPDYPIVEKILAYRTHAKLRSTYAEGLKNYISADGRIYGTFLQTVTATGRLSSANPNLQNIPVRIELGREIRRLFVPKDGCIFIDADYSQIELRVMAHMSEDPNLIDAYNHAADVHALTASQVFHVPLSEVTREMRSNAKAVNFGIIYGISSFGLAENLSIGRGEAERYIEGYFKAFPGIERFQKESVAFARENGFVKTLYGRIRPIPELNSQSFHERMFAERVAMNSPIQGTAADIMKIAMIRVWEKLREEGLRSRIVLQVHDELLVEAELSEADRVEEILVSEMEHAAELRVRLEVEAKRGNSWYETK